MEIFSGTLGWEQSQVHVYDNFLAAIGPAYMAVILLVKSLESTV